MSREIKNRDAIIEQLTDLLMQFAKECNRYQTDVYLYFDRETNTATLDTFTNIGGNSWLDDNHYTIYRDKEWYEDWSDYYCNRGDFAWGLDMSNEDFEKEVLAFLDLDDDEKDDYEIEWYDELRYVTSRDDYRDKLISVYEDSVEEHRADYAEQAEDIFEREEVDLLDWINSMDVKENEDE